MAVNPMYRSNPVRMMGMASGMDTESIIQATLRMHQFKIDQQMKNRKLIEWKQQAHNDIKTQITSLRQTYLSNLGSKSMMSRNAFNASTATASGKFASAVTVTSTVGASVGSMKINQVVSLAKGANISSAGKISANGNGFTTSTKLGDLSFFGTDGASGITFTDWKASVVDASGNSTSLNVDKAGLADLGNNAANWGDEYASVTVNGNALTISRTDTGDYTWSLKNGSGTVVDGGAVTFDGDGKATLSDVAGIGNVSLAIDGENVKISAKDGDKTVLSERNMTFFRDSVGITGANNQEVKLVKNASGTITNNGRVVDPIGQATIKINDVEIDLNSNMTVAEMLSKVNSSAAGVTMSYDRMQDRFTIESKTITVGGVNNNLKISDEAGDVLGKLLGVSNYAPSDNPLDPPPPTTASDLKINNGTWAEIIVNGETIQRTTNNFEYRGVSIRLNHTTDALGVSSDPNDENNITVNVVRDTSKAFDAIKDFIDSYNSIIARLEGLLNERKTGNEASYAPLTDEEKSMMTEKQIEEWEAIAKKGIMRNDRGIQDLVTSLRATFFEAIEGVGMSPSQIGLTTGPFNGGTGGQIIINEDRLKAALEEDPDRVADIFIRIDTTGGETRGVGLLHKIDRQLSRFVNSTQDNTLYALEKSYKEANDRIAKLEERMYAEEDRLYRQFAAMETAMSQMQSQGDWFNAMLGSTK